MLDKMWFKINMVKDVTFCIVNMKADEVKLKVDSAPGKGQSKICKSIVSY